MGRFGITLALLVPALVGLGQAADKPPTEGGGGVYKKVLKSTVWIINAEQASGGRTRYSTGSGSIIDTQRRIVLTNYHVVAESSVVMVMFPDFEKGQLVSEREHYFGLLKANKGYEGKVLGRDSSKDLAIIQLSPKQTLPAGTTGLKLAGESVGPGDTVHSIGNPGVSGALWAYTRGDVKAVYRKHFRTGGPGGEGAFEIDARVVETTSPVNPGDSGGPVVNAAGDLVAVTQGMLNEAAGRSISYFIDLSEVRGVLKKAGFTQLASAAASPTADEPASTTKPATDADAAKAKAEKDEALAKSKLKLAKSSAGNPVAYKQLLEDLIEAYPNTKAAQDARDILKTLRR